VFIFADHFFAPHGEKMIGKKAKTTVLLQTKAAPTHAFYYIRYESDVNFLINAEIAFLIGPLAQNQRTYSGLRYSPNALVRGKTICNLQSGAL